MAALTRLCALFAEECGPRCQQYEHVPETVNKHSHPKNASFMIDEGPDHANDKPSHQHWDWEHSMEEDEGQ